MRRWNGFPRQGASMPLLDSEYFTLSDIDGFTIAQSNIASVVVPFVDGDTITNIQTNPRAVTLYLSIKQAVNVETAKRYILQYVKLKLEGKIHLVQDGRDIELAGTVESIDLPRFSAGCTIAITLHCSQPYWRDVDFCSKRNFGDYQSALFSRRSGRPCLSC